MTTEQLAVDAVGLAHPGGIRVFGRSGERDGIGVLDGVGGNSLPEPVPPSARQVSFAVHATRGVASSSPTVLPVTFG
jgi:hypothetical protein